ncbi:phosphoglycerate mutase [Phaeobacter sp. 11ANDIMAR09]|nr:phosphoglycerate mutase [Phaeobacter sp. 11ANDIMAR09]
MTHRLPKTSFCLIRHGETTANRDGVIAGRLEVSLTETGRAQAQALSLLTWPDAYVLFTSPMERAKETCRFGFPSEKFQTHPGLRERDWGMFEGRPLAELPPRDGRPDQGEDWGEMINRVAEAIHDSYQSSHGRLPIFVCHSGVIRAARILAGFHSVGTRPANARPIYFNWTGDGHQETTHDV